MERRYRCMNFVCVKLALLAVTNEFHAIFFHGRPVIALSKDFLYYHWAIYVTTTGARMCFSYNFISFLVCET